MALTFIDTNRIAHTQAPGAGEIAEILNNELCGAENVVGRLHWLQSGEMLNEKCDDQTHQLIYLMEGEGTITLNSKTYPVKRGAGVYLGPSESASIAQAGSVALKLFHLVVTKSPS